MAEEAITRRVAYAAIGLPVHVAGKVRTSVTAVKERAGDARERMAAAAESSIAEWVDTGEDIIDAARTKLRQNLTEADRAIRDGAATVKDVGRAIHAVATEPIVALESIDGIGPRYAEKLAAAGVTSTRALIERCDSSEAVRRLAGQADIPAALLSTWRDEADLSRVDGIGPEQTALLNASGVGTITQIAAFEPAELRGRLAAINAEFDWLPAVPSEALLVKWIETARRMGG